MLRNVVAASSLVPLFASKIFVTEATGSKTRKKTTASTVTVTESLVKIS
jgi:hypothetical protein